jgi:hypothetical protein
VRSQLYYFLYLLILVPVALEGTLLMLGYRPFQPVPFAIESEPEYCIIPHQNLGFALRPGQYRVTINEGLDYTVTHGSDSLRITQTTPPTSATHSAYFFGCSYTYGMGVPDSLTFPFLINAEKADWTTKNFGVPGYGTVQSYLQLQACIARGDIPEVAIVNYADFHDDRNALTPAYRRDLYLGYQRANVAVSSNMAPARVPYATPAPVAYTVQYCPWDRIYDNWHARETFATINLLQDLRDYQHRRQLDAEAITAYLFQQIQNRCTAHGIRLIVTGITRSPETTALLNTLSASGLETLDLAVDLKQNRYRNYPYDDHPNAEAHRIFARRISNYLLTFEEK